ncbi:MAG: hypothetical protein ACQESR_31080 [Planctomycetota bacterium]
MLLALLGFCIGCDNDQKDEEKVELGRLPYVRATHHDELKAELKRIEAEQATPRLLEASRAGAVGEPGNEPARRLIRELSKICPVPAVQRALREIERVYPTGRFDFDPVELERFREIQSRHLSKLKQYRRVFRRDGFQFHVSLRDGLLADLSALDHAEFAHRLEAFCVADELGRGKPSAAMFALRTMLLIDARLSAVPRVSARRAAARLRAEALNVAAALVEHPQCSSTLRKQLLRILEAQLDNWTPDRVTWVGDRALGLHAYELVRDGQLMSILTPNEIARLKDAGDLNAFCTAVQDSVDEDEWFYLSTMRRVIDACEQPFFERVDVLERINQEADRLLDTQDAPLFATTVLLPDLARAHRLMAIDRARCEAWVMALRAAANEPVDRTAVNPVTGKPYELVRETDAVVVHYLAGTEDEEATAAVSIPVREG